MIYILRLAIRGKKVQWLITAEAEFVLIGKLTLIIAYSLIGNFSMIDQVVFSRFLVSVLYWHFSKKKKRIYSGQVWKFPIDGI